MKELRNLTGGYPRQMDYLLNLQTELLTLGNSLFSGLGFDMVLAGCAITDNGNGTVNIGSGLVYVAGEALRFDGLANVAANRSKTFVKGAYTTTDSKLFGDGSPKDVYKEAKAVVANITGSASEIKIGLTLYNLKQYIQDTVQGFEVKGATKDIYDFDGDFLDNFDASGLGITPRWIGWALDNENNGTVGSIGRSLINAGTYTEPSNGQQTVFAYGQKYGEANHKLTAGEIPKHRFKITLPRGRYASVASGTDHPYGPSSPNNGTDDFYTDFFGNDQAHNNVSPAVAIYRVVKIV